MINISMTSIYVPTKPSQTALFTKCYYCAFKLGLRTTTALT